MVQGLDAKVCTMYDSPSLNGVMFRLVAPLLFLSRPSSGLLQEENHPENTSSELECSLNAFNPALICPVNVGVSPL